MSSDMSLIWDKERKTLEAGLDWRRDESHPNRQEVQLQINHPSFEKVRTVVFALARQVSRATNSTFAPAISHVAFDVSDINLARDLYL